MKRLFYVLVAMIFVVTACGQAPAAIPTLRSSNTEAVGSTLASATDVPVSAGTATAEPTSTATLAASPTFLPTLNYPAEGYGPTNFPADVDPLTGLKVANPALLQRRPMLIKISNMPRTVRPQWGLSLADIVFDYYTEEGSTRFAAIFYGNDASIVGPIRSGRFIDGYLVQGYKAMFAFGSAYQAEMDRFLASDYATRIVLEGPITPLTRYEPNGMNHLIVNTADLSTYATRRGLNKVQNLDNMAFKLAAPAGGLPGTQVFVDYSTANYNRWDYEPSSGRYLRFSDTAELTSMGQGEQYAQLTDRLTNLPVAFDNVVVLLVNYEAYSKTIYDILLTGSGDAVAFRDGQGYKVKWQRNATDVVSLANPDGSAFPFKPGTTCFEVMGQSSTFTQGDQGWRFTQLTP